MTLLGTTKNTTTMNKTFNVEIYRDGLYYCAYIGAENSSGYEIEETTIEGVCERIAEYFATEYED